MSNIQLQELTNMNVKTILHQENRHHIAANFQNHESLQPFYIKEIRCKMGWIKANMLQHASWSNTNEEINII